MRSRRFDSLAVPTAIVVGAVFLVGLVQLFLLRFEQGDIYPAYSSLRADPLGTRALFESLGSWGDRQASRNFQPLDAFDSDGDTTLLVLGDRAPYPLTRLPSGLVDNLNAFMRKGGRIVVTFAPRNREPVDDTNDVSWSSSFLPEEEDQEDEDKPKKWIALSNWWDIAFTDVPVGPDAMAQCSPSAPEGMPDMISCHTSLCLTNLGSGWTALYARDNRPVIVERPIGRGSLVLSTPSYYVSNQALRDERHPTLLAWLAGEQPRIVFDETHHGLADHLSVTRLARGYGLQWLGLALVTLALLFVWQMKSSLVPVRAVPDPQSPTTAGVATGKDSASGLVNLLRRSIPAGTTLDVCLQEWRKTTVHTTAEQDAALARAEAICRMEHARPLRERNPAGAYSAICDTLRVRPGLPSTDARAESEKRTQESDEAAD